MVTSTINNIIHAIFLIFFFSIFSNFVTSLNIVSPTDGSTFVFGTLIPVNVVNSNIDTATVYTLTFVCSAGTYQVTGLALGTNYTLIPAGLHGLTNLIATAAGGTTAVTAIQITAPVPPTPCPSPNYAPTACFPSNSCPLSANVETECPRPCYTTHNMHCDWQNYRRRSHPNRCSRKDNKQVDFTFADLYPLIERKENRISFNRNRCSRNEKQFQPGNATPNAPRERQTNRQNHCDRTEERSIEHNFSTTNDPFDTQNNRLRSYPNRCFRNVNNQNDHTSHYRFNPRDRASFSQYSSFDQIRPIPPRFNTPFENDPRDYDLF